jgi:hypothetical protein
LPEEVAIDTMEKPQQVLETFRGRKVAQKTITKGRRNFLIRVIFSEKTNKKRDIYNALNICT